MRNPVCKNCGRLESSHHHKGSSYNKDCPTVFEEEPLGAYFSTPAPQVAPLQTVSREAIELLIKNWHSKGIATDSRLANMIEALQLPHPVAPVQASVAEAIEALKWGVNSLDEQTMEEACFKALKSLESLTTTQSAPSVGSVPMVREIQETIQNHATRDAYESAARAVHALLTSRTEGSAPPATAPSGKEADHE